MKPTIHDFYKMITDLCKKNDGKVNYWVVMEFGRTKLKFKIKTMRNFIVDLHKQGKIRMDSKHTISAI
jgi:hypothetical protein